MITAEDDTFLRRALRLAMNGRGHVEPNPMVGCVLVKNGQVVGEGWHQKVGEAHAEPNALADCVARGNSPAGATAYVTLEPCCHTNKRTPPCAPRLIAAKVARVVVGCLDPNPDVNGQGVAMLRAAGIAVDTLPDSPLPPGEGLGERAPADVRGERMHTTLESALSPALSRRERELDAARFRQFIAPFAGELIVPAGNDTYQTLKWAEDADGCVAGPRGVRAQISSEPASRLVHQLRARSSMIVVGIGTVLSDDAMLTVRGIDAARQPTRLVLDRLLRLPSWSRLVTSARDPAAGRVAVICAEDTYFESPRVAELQALGVRVSEQRFADPRAAIDADFVFHGGELPHREILVEPGPTLARALLPSADRLWVFRSPKRVGDATAPRAAAIPDHWVATGTIDVGGDRLTEYLNVESPAFFAPTPSADFVLALESIG